MNEQRAARALVVCGFRGGRERKKGRPSDEKKFGARERLKRGRAKAMAAMGWDVRVCVSRDGLHGAEVLLIEA